MTTAIAKWHPAAEAYPMMSGEDYERLKASVMKHGVLKPIDVYCGTAFPEFIGVGIDGRNRARAAAECGRPCPIRKLTDDAVGGSLTDYIASVNSARRHEGAGMRAAIAAGLEPCYAAEAAKRKAANGGDKVSAQKIAQDLQKTLENPARAEVELIPQPLDKVKARQAAAAACDVNDRYVQDAKKLLTEAPALFEKVKTGSVNLPAAMATLKHKLEDPAAWAQLLEGAISIEDFNARFDLKEKSPDLRGRVRRAKIRLDEAQEEAAHSRPAQKRSRQKAEDAELQVGSEGKIACPTCEGRGWIANPQDNQNMTKH